MEYKRLFINVLGNEVNSITLGVYNIGFLFKNKGKVSEYPYNT